MLSLYAVDKSFGRSKILKSIDLQLDKKTYGLKRDAGDKPENPKYKHVHCNVYYR